MPRPLSSIETTDAAPSVGRDDSGLTRSTARAFAAAVSALLIATLVVSRSSDALTTEGTITGSAISSGTVSLLDDDRGRSLFDLSDVAPGRPAIRCLEIAYDGTILPVDLAVRAEADGTLAPYLDVLIEQGDGGGFESCEGFVARPVTWQLEAGSGAGGFDSGVVYDGTLAELADAGWRPLGSMVNQGERRSYRITFRLQDRQEALGRSTNADFTWEVTPS